MYRVSHLLVYLGWVDFDLGVSLSCLAASATFPLVEHSKSKSTQQSMSCKFQCGFCSKLMRNDCVSLESNVTLGEVSSLLYSRRVGFSDIHLRNYWGNDIGISRSQIDAHFLHPLFCDPSGRSKPPVDIDLKAVKHSKCCISRLRNSNASQSVSQSIFRAREMLTSLQKSRE